MFSKFTENDYFPEDKIGGRYEVLGQIGSGGSSLIFRAFDEHTDKIVAMKTLRSPANIKQRQSFAAEAQRIQSVKHPNVVRIHDFFTDADDRDWMVMDYVPGQDLSKVMWNNGSSPMSLDRFEQVAAQTLTALDAVHLNNILHLDIKPQNIMISVTPEAGLLKVTLIDFGISTTTCSADQTQLSQHSGSIFYTSPESFSGKKHTPSSDIYSLGCVFYYLLTGRHPFDGESDVEVMASHLMSRVDPLGSLRKDLPWNTITTVSQMIAMEAKARPSTAREVWTCLASAAGDPLKIGGLASKSSIGFLPLPKRKAPPLPSPAKNHHPIKRGAANGGEGSLKPLQHPQLIHFS